MMLALMQNKNLTNIDKAYETNMLSFPCKNTDDSWNLSFGNYGYFNILRSRFRLF